MILSPAQAVAALETPASRSNLDRALRHEARLRLHVEPVAEKAALSEAYADFLAWAEGLLPVDKFARFQQLIGTPLPSVELTARIFLALGRVFEAKNSRFAAEFTDPALSEDFAELRERLGDDDFWGTRAFEAIKTQPHALLVVDLPAEVNAEGTLPDPYYYLLPTAQLIDVRHRVDGKQCEFAAFWIAGRTAPTAGAPTGMRRAAVLDDATWRVYAYDETKAGADRWVLLTEAAHGLGYCPARPLWPVGVSKDDPVGRVAPLTPVLDALDKYVFWSVLTDYQRSYNAAPILWQFEEKCGAKGPLGEECEHGTINYRHVRPVADPYHPGQSIDQEYFVAKPCAACAGKRLMGPGTVIQVPVPTADTGDTRNPVGALATDAAALKLAFDRLDADAEAVFERVAGATASASATAINEKQVRAGFETRADVLIRLAWALEESHEWALRTVALLRYGPRFVRLNISYGDEFYLKTVAELATEYQEQRDAGAPAYVLAGTRELMAETAWRLDPDQRDRARILADLEPYQEMSIGDALLNASLLDPLLVGLKLNFTACIRRFEREQLDVRLFASAGVSYERKISSILETLLAYVRKNPLNPGAPATGILRTDRSAAPLAG